MVKNKIKISVIVPVYNVADYVSKCLDSLINQTLQDIEIICIDDKSTDNSLEILKQYKKQDSRIKIIEQSENMGVAAARNAGLDIARGEYIGFVDPDDWIDLNFYETLYNLAQQTDSDIVKGHSVVFNQKNGAEFVSSLNYEIANDVRIFEHEFWSAIYKSEFLNSYNIRFPNGITNSEDKVFLCKCNINTTKLSITNDVFYHYLLNRDNSLDSFNMSDVRITSTTNACNIMIDIIDNGSLSTQQKDRFIIFFVADTLIYNMQKQYNNQNVLKRLFDYIHTLLRDSKYSKVLAARIKQTCNKRIYNYIKNDKFAKFSKLKQRSTGKTWHKRVYLFGFIPIILINNKNDNTSYLLFDCIPLLRIKRHRYFYVLGILFIKLKG